MPSAVPCASLEGLGASLKGLFTRGENIYTATALAAKAAKGTAVVVYMKNAKNPRENAHIQHLEARAKMTKAGVVYKKSSRIIVSSSGPCSSFFIYRFQIRCSSADTFFHRFRCPAPSELDKNDQSVSKNH